MTFLEPKQLNITQDNQQLDHTTIITLIIQEELIKVDMMVEFILEMPVNIIYVYKINLLKVINSKLFIYLGMQDIWQLLNHSILNWQKVNMLDFSYPKDMLMDLKWDKVYNTKDNLKFTTTKMHNTFHNLKLNHNNLTNDNFYHSDQ